jgi:hypothetical protein
MPFRSMQTCGWADGNSRPVAAKKCRMPERVFLMVELRAG